MKCLSNTLLFILFWGTINGYAQADFITNGSRQYDIIDRLQVLLGNDSVLNFSSVRPLDRRVITERLAHLQSALAAKHIRLSKADQYNLQLLLQDNFEWTPNAPIDTALPIKQLFSQHALTHTAQFGIGKKDFSLFINPVGAYQTGSDNQLAQRTFLNTRGFYLRGKLGKNIGFYSYYRTQQERNPLYVQQYVQQYNAVPGVGYFKKMAEGGYDYFDGRGGITVRASKGIDLAFVYDKVFIGDGFRSLILADGSQSYLHLKLNARFWKFNYHNIFAELTSAFKPTLEGDFLRPKKYMAFHYLDFQLTKRINIGFYENVIFGRQNGFDFNYLNPVIFYQTAQQQLGSPDKLTLGFNAKANVGKRTQLYSQLVINEFLINEILHYRNGFWSNKQALQVGGKMVNFLGVPNLDVQGEINLIRPFVYSHRDSVGTFSHYNQPLAHPLGANLKEFIAIVKYQPIPRLHLLGKLIYTRQGLDSANRNFGSNIFRSYNDNQGILYGYKTAGGKLSTILIASLQAAYEVLPNIFLDANVFLRNQKIAGQVPFNSQLVSLGLRVNMQRRNFDF